MRYKPRYEIEFRELIEQFGAVQVAKIMGVQRSAIPLMVDAGRRFLFRRVGGNWYYQEVKPWKMGTDFEPKENSRQNELHKRMDDLDVFADPWSASNTRNNVRETKRSPRTRKKAN